MTGFRWGADGQPGCGLFVGDWTAEAVVAFVKRVDEIIEEERQRAEPEDAS